MYEPEKLELGNALVEAAARGSLDAVRRMIGDGVRVDARDINGWTALMWSAYHGHLEVASGCLDARY